MANKKLFQNFRSIDTQEWENSILRDLKGADFNKKLVTRTIEGFSILPYYRRESLNPLSYLNIKPGFFPFIRGKNHKLEKVKIQQSIVVDDYNTSNNKALKIIDNGINSIEFDFVNKKSVCENDIFALLNDINLSKVQLVFKSENLSVQLSKILAAFFKLNMFSNIDTSISFDPISSKTVSPAYFDNDFTESLQNIYEFTKHIEGITILNVQAFNFKNAGSSSVQELAFGLSIACDYLSVANKLGIDIDSFVSKIKFSFGVGSNYFIEIAKLRAARLLWSKIVETYGVKNRDNAKMNIHSVTSDWNKTAYDPYVNVLRTTTEAMSAIIGGTDSLLVKPFNSSYEDVSEFSERIARNIQIILNEEAYFDKFIDPAGGSYYIENLTNSIVENTWNLFLKVEKLGGYNKAFDNGSIKSQIEETANKRDLAIAMKKEVLLGTNQYAALDEKLNFKIAKSEKAGGNAIRIYRGAEAFEELRQRTENLKNTPKILLLNFGNLAMRKARASFATNFFACGGFEIVENNAVTSAEEALNQINEIKADIIVLCSSDDEYFNFASEIYKEIGDKTILTIAGYPKNYIEELKNIGIENFIHVKSNILETLTKFQNIILQK